MERIVIKLSGDIDHHTAPGLKRTMDKRFAEANPKQVILDMGGVGFMDSSGIGLILGRYRDWKKKGAVIFVKNVRGQVGRVFTASGLFQVIKRVD